MVQNGNCQQSLILYLAKGHSSSFFFFFYQWRPKIPRIQSLRRRMRVRTLTACLSSQNWCKVGNYVYVVIMLTIKKWKWYFVTLLCCPTYITNLATRTKNPVGCLRENTHRESWWFQIKATNCSETLSHVLTYRFFFFFCLIPSKLSRSNSVSQRFSPTTHSFWTSATTTQRRRLILQASLCSSLSWGSLLCRAHQFQLPGWFHYRTWTFVQLEEKV